MPYYARAVTPAEPIPKRTAHILVVEDNPDTAESLTMLLELLGHRVRAVHDGVAALDAARTNVPDVMLVDIGLPGMDGSCRPSSPPTARARFSRPRCARPSPPTSAARPPD